MSDACQWKATVDTISHGLPDPQITARSSAISSLLWMHTCSVTYYSASVLFALVDGFPADEGPAPGMRSASPLHDSGLTLTSSISGRSDDGEVPPTATPRVWSSLEDDGLS